MPDPASPYTPGWTLASVTTIYPQRSKIMSRFASNSLHDPMDARIAHKFTWSRQRLCQGLGILDTELRALYYTDDITPRQDIYSYREVKAIILANTFTFDERGEDARLDSQALKERQPQYLAAYDPESKPMPWMDRLFFSSRQIAGLFRERGHGLDAFLASSLAKFIRVNEKRLYYPSFVHMFF